MGRGTQDGRSAGKQGSITGIGQRDCACMQQLEVSPVAAKAAVGRCIRMRRWRRAPGSPALRLTLRGQRSREQRDVHLTAAAAHRRCPYSRAPACERRRSSESAALRGRRQGAVGQHPPRTTAGPPPSPVRTLGPHLLGVVRQQVDVAHVARGAAAHLEQAQLALQRCDERARRAFEDVLHLVRVGVQVVPAGGAGQQRGRCVLAAGSACNRPRPARAVCAECMHARPASRAPGTNALCNNSQLVAGGVLDVPAAPGRREVEVELTRLARPRGRSGPACARWQLPLLAPPSPGRSLT